MGFVNRMLKRSADALRVAAVAAFASLAFEGAAAGRGQPVFPLKVSQSGRYLIDQNGRPFFVMGDTPWFLQKTKFRARSG